MKRKTKQQSKFPYKKCYWIIWIFFPLYNDVSGIGTGDKGYLCEFFLGFVRAKFRQQILRSSLFISKCYYNSFDYVNWFFYIVSKCQFVISFCFLLKYFLCFYLYLIEMFYKSQQNVWFGFFSISLENFHLNNLHCDFLLCYFECSFKEPSWFLIF